MADGRVVVDFVEEVSWSPADVFRTHDPTLAPQRLFTLRGAGQAKLPDFNPQYDVFRRVLTLLASIEHPLRAELAVDGTVLSLSVPHVGRVIALFPAEGGWVSVHVSSCASPLRLRRGSMLLAPLEAALRAKTPLIVSTTDDHEIVAVQDGTHTEGVRRHALTGADVIPTLTIVTPERAQELFDAMLQQSCPIPSGFEDCIPFLLPDNGCWARAERMCDLLGASQVEAGKLWVFGGLKTRTENRSDCRAEWIYHVAPVVRVDTGEADLLVLDPSVFCRVQTTEAWLEALGDTRAVCQLTDRTVYFQTEPDDGIEERPGKMSADLKELLAWLLCRSIEKGAPPYARCRPCPNDRSGGPVEPFEDPRI